MLNKKQVVSAIVFLGCISFSKAQTDISYNPLLELGVTGQNSDQTHVQIGNFKVKGSPYLLDATFVSEFYQKGVAYMSNNAGYNMYYQRLDHIDETKKQLVMFDVTLVDSFILSSAKNNFNKSNKTLTGAKFINGTLINKKYDYFLQVIAKSSKVTIYKKHIVTLGAYGSDISGASGGSSFRKFVFDTQYYIFPNDGATKELEKISFKESKLIAALSKYHNAADLQGLDLSENGENNLKDLLKVL
jgi:hypothetical protein